ncbi:beta-galactosidase trimerization domain-containing protein [candidate division KSB1 bacterium]|nr:beta-galactosidase trimerization domain-containing protein [candidate division KSB1 bacterium]
MKILCPLLKLNPMSLTLMMLSLFFIVIFYHKTAYSQEKWYEQPMRIAALQCNFENGKNLEVIDKWIDMGFNVEQLFHPMADNYSALYNPQQHREILTAYLQKAHNNHLRIILYLNVHILGPSHEKNKKIWSQRNQKNKIVMLYDTYPSICLHSPWRDHFFSVLDSLAAFDLDGIFLDGPVINQQGCHCEFCKRKYKEWYGQKYPKSLSSFNFNQRTRDDFLNEAYQHWKALKPESIFYMNLPVLHCTPSFVNIKDALEYNDLIGTEGGFMFYDPPKDAFLWRPGLAAKLIAALPTQKPRVIFMAGDQKPWSWYLHSPAETQLCIASCVANGANVWWGIHGSTQLLSTPSAAASREMFQFLAANETYFHKSKPVARVGLMYSFTSERISYSSYETSDFTGEIKKGKRPAGDLKKSLYGFYDMLIRSQIPFNLLTDIEASIPEYQNYDCIILPSTRALSRNTVEALRDYVQAGGNLIADFACSLFDNSGRSSGDFALADVFGVHFNQDYFTLANHNYFVPADSSSFIFKDLSLPYYPAPLLGIKVKPGTDATVQAFYLSPLPGRYVPLTQPENPFIIHHHFGKGQCLFFAGAFGQMYYDYAADEYRKIFANAVHHFSQPLLELKDEIGSALEIVIRQQESRILIHLINANGDMIRPIQKIHPLQSINLKLYLPGQWASVRALVSNQELSYDFHSDFIEFQLPELKNFEVIVIE